MNERARSVLRRVVCDGKKLREVAEEMGVSVSTASSLQHRALIQMGYSDKMLFERKLYIIDNLRLAYRFGQTINL